MFASSAAAASLRSSRAVAQRALLAPSAAATPAPSAMSAAAAARRTFGSTAAQRSSSHGHHESPYDPPTGWLFGVKPGDKYKNEGWEKPFFWGFCGSLILFVCIIPFKPDTSIQTWALEEARRRLEAEGILQDPFPDTKQ